MGGVRGRSSPFLAGFLAGASSTHWLVADREGTIQACNGAAASRLKLPATDLVGSPIWQRLTDAAADLLRAQVSSAERMTGEKLRLNFIDADREPFTLECEIDTQPNGFMLLGEPLREEEEALSHELMMLNNQLSVLSRENERRRKELAKAKAELERTLGDLQDSYWHLKKIQEVLPICMECGKVKTGDSEWGEVIEYLKKNALFLSHSYCPGCLKKVEEMMDLQ